MTEHESEVMAFFLRQLAQMQGPNKNPEPDDLIRESLACQPGVHYQLMCSGLRLEQALQQARSQIIQLQKALAEQTTARDQSDTYIPAGNKRRAPGNLHR